MSAIQSTSSTIVSESFNAHRPLTLADVENPSTKHVIVGMSGGVDSSVSGREVRCVPADRASQAHRDDQLADVADGQRAVPRRRFWAFLCLCTVQDRICR